MEHNLLLKENRELEENLAKRLKKYGLVLMPSVLAESHSHDDWTVWIVYVKEEKNPKSNGWISMHSKTIYWLEEPSDWYKMDEDMRIFRR
jgi:hypothetical protein